MSLNYNKVILSGRLTADPIPKTTQSGLSVVSFSIAVNRPKGADGQQAADFFGIVAWRQTADFICQYFQKGKPIFIEGELQTRKWTDSQGKTQVATEILANKVSFVESQGSGIQGSAGVTQPVGTATFEDINTDEDLPF